MTKAEKREERLLILRTMIREDDGRGLRGVDIADEAGEGVTRRGIGQKLASMALDGLVEGHQPPARRRETRGRYGATHYAPPPMLWSVTDKGRVLAGEGNGDA